MYILYIYHTKELYDIMYKCVHCYVALEYRAYLFNENGTSSLGHIEINIIIRRNYYRFVDYPINREESSC